MEQRPYRYIGSATILAALPQHSTRARVQSTSDVLTWVTNTYQPHEATHRVIATFIVDLTGCLWISDQRSEHVLCAAGQNVLSAGEITFEITEISVEAVEITNQSTGYCPEPESFGVIHDALNAAEIAHPPCFTTEFLFRRCAACQSINIVKDGWFVCAVCEASLPEHWNVDALR